MDVAIDAQTGPEVWRALGSVCGERGLGHARPSKRSCPETAVLASAAALASASAGDETCPKPGRAGPGPGWTRRWDHPQSEMFNTSVVGLVT